MKEVNRNATGNRRRSKLVLSVCEISYTHGILLQGERTIVPKTLRSDVKNCIHQGHKGIVKCKRQRNLFSGQISIMRLKTWSRVVMNV